MYIYKKVCKYVNIKYLIWLTPQNKPKITENYKSAAAYLLPHMTLVKEEKIGKR